MPETEFCLRCTPYGQCGFKKLETRLGFSEITVESLEGLIEESDAFKLRECPFHEGILTTLLRQREMLLAQEREGFFPELKARHLGVELQAGSVRQWSKSDMPWVVSNIVDELEWLKSQGLIVEEPEEKR